MGRNADQGASIETAIHFLLKIQSEGWVLESMEYLIDHSRPRPEGPRLPVEAALIIRLAPH